MGKKGISDERCTVEIQLKSVLGGATVQDFQYFTSHVNNYARLSSSSIK